MALAVGIASVGLIPIAITRIRRRNRDVPDRLRQFERVGRALSAQVIVLVAASIAIGKLIFVSGAARMARPRVWRSAWNWPRQQC